MSPEIERLLGGYATSTLTEDERTLLFEEALEDQDVFNALQDEEALRDLLAHAESRRAVERALNQTVVSKPKRLWPWAVGVAATAAMVAFAIFILRPQPESAPQVLTEMAPAGTRHAFPGVAPVLQAYRPVNADLRLVELVRDNVTLGPSDVLRKGDAIHVQVPGNLVVAEQTPQGWKPISLETPIRVNDETRLRLQYGDTPTVLQTIVLTPGQPVARESTYSERKRAGQR